MRGWSTPKSGRPASFSATISPSRTAPSATSRSASSATSGYVAVTSLPLRLITTTPPPPTPTIARTPSHFISYAQPGPVTSSAVPGVASIGSGRSVMAGTPAADRVASRSGLGRAVGSGSDADSGGRGSVGAGWSFMRCRSHVSSSSFPVRMRAYRRGTPPSPPSGRPVRTAITSSSRHFSVS